MATAVIVHGGAGQIDVGDCSSRKEGLRAAREAAWTVLQNGGGAVQAAVAAVVALEDDPQFNAGYGSVLNRDGFVEMDAAVMTAEERAFGAVAAVRDVKNPILLALEVLNSEHVLLAAEGASRFARERGIPSYDPARLTTQRQMQRWRRARRKELVEKSGTVGAVAMDAEGRMAAATSTGGMLDKRVGRVGDTPLPGAGNYAAAGLGAASGTGHGEYFARALAALRAVEALRNVDGDEAVRLAVAEVAGLGGHGGIILLDSAGITWWSHDIPYMGVAWRDSRGEGAACGKNEAAKMRGE